MIFGPIEKWADHGGRFCSGSGVSWAGQAFSFVKGEIVSHAVVLILDAHVPLL